MKKYGTSATNVVCGNRGEEKGMQRPGAYEKRTLVELTRRWQVLRAPMSSWVDAGAQIDVEGRAQLCILNGSEEDQCNVGWNVVGSY